MSIDVRRPSIAQKAAPSIDENGVPMIWSSLALAWIGLGLFVGVPATAFTVFRMVRMAATGEASEGGETWDLSNDYRLMLWVTGALRTLWLGWAIATAYQFFSRRSNAPRMLIILYVTSILLNVVEAAWEASFADGDASHVAEAISAAIFPTFWAVIWSIYLTRSQTAKRVFVYPLREDGEGVERSLAGGADA